MRRRRRKREIPSEEFPQPTLHLTAATSSGWATGLMSSVLKMKLFVESFYIPVKGPIFCLFVYFSDILLVFLRPRGHFGTNSF